MVMVSETRLRRLNEHEPRAGRYVLYWMQASQRTRFNHALEYAIEQANALNLAVVVGFGLMDDYPEANLRHYAFMLQGLRDVKRALAGRGIALVVRRGQPAEVALSLAEEAALVVCDRGYLRHQVTWRDQVADRAAACVVEVESDVVVPVEQASEKLEFAARTIRPKIHRRLEENLSPLPSRKVKRDSAGMKLPSDINVERTESVLEGMKLDRSVGISPIFIGGQEEAQHRLKGFMRDKLPGYAKGRNEPAAGQTSTMSAYLHFGQISPIEIALAVRASSAPKVDRDAYIEELIVRRELSVNFVTYNGQYDRYEGLPVWAKQTLAEHRRDKRPALYSRADLEAGRTSDPYWNAAQHEMTNTGFMHNYMRMYWGKKIIEWSPSPQEAFETALHLNNKYFLCGRDPNGYTGVAWLFGLHDRPWQERPAFGKVRYMNAAGLERKFDIDAYVRKVEQIQPASGS